jgi:hypothetical protein
LASESQASLSKAQAGESLTTCSELARHDTDTWNKERRTIDRGNDEYHKVYTDPATGEVVYQAHGRLSEHQGHGSAKK